MKRHKHWSNVTNRQPKHQQKTKQLRKCSNNALVLQKVNGREDVQDGVVDVVVNANLGDAEDSFQCVREADAALQSLDVGTTHTFTMYICPGEMEFGSAAWGEINGSKTWYHDLYGSYPFVQMHELGYVDRERCGSMFYSFKIVLLSILL